MAKRKLLNLRVIGNSRQLLNQFIDNNKEYIFRETYKGIKHAIDQDKNTAEICSINTNSAIATIPEMGWENALSSSLGYFESVDEFEMCKEINDTLKMLYNAKRSSKYSKTISGSVVTN
jgi:hypothetical protein